jgi:hypothetical protein
MAAIFDERVLRLLTITREVEIETSRTPGAPSHRTIIWVVVDAEGRVLIRTYRGPGSRWFREASSNAECRLRVGGHVLEVRVVPAIDEERIAAYNQELLHKYPRSTSTPLMLEDWLLPTTLQVVPR